jgi:hypothetical protein
MSIHAQVDSVGTVGSVSNAVVSAGIGIPKGKPFGNVLLNAPATGRQSSTTIPSDAHSSGTSPAWASISPLMWVRITRLAPALRTCSAIAG